MVTIQLLLLRQTNVLLDENVVHNNWESMGGMTSNVSNSNNCSMITATATANTTTTTTNTSTNTSAGQYSYYYSKADKETAILVTTNWIPSAPSIDLVKEVMDSLNLIEGLSPKAPTYIVIDHIFPESHRDGKKNKEERIALEVTLEEYSFNLMKEYMHRDNVHVIVNKVNLHIGGNINKTLELLEPETKYLYVLQHDFKFIKPINHTAIILAMKTYPQRLKHVRFNKKTNVPKRRGDVCWYEPDAQIHVDGANFTKTCGWSDNNHFSSVEHYKRLIKELGSTINRPLEAPMQHKMYQFNNCSEWAQHVYGSPWQGRHILHLDGRNSFGV
eukprot:CAMPEP_0176500792 /NCGR_PEP_ID=MMETSP0200_2-20121128/13786_1 /TAXON_ID=947934 /ORGANISM="Chaetoceros sp., Strain GSL56" /LENGTH=329 /DNA_ID=CAMNT_0017899575 /DNA_START=148 /DNA_END=1137 /DNA_ORIENTATION=-